MSKQREGLPDLMGEALGGGEATVANSTDYTEGLKNYSMRLPTGMVETLRAHFATDGLKLSQGIRMVLSRYLRDEGLR